MIEKAGPKLPATGSWGPLTGSRPSPREQALPEVQAAPGGNSHNVKLHVRFDAPSARYVYLTVDSSSGEVERQYPPQEALRRIARMRQIAGLALDKKL